MVDERNSMLRRIFRRVIAWRWAIVAFYALLLPVALHYALKVGSDNAIDRLIVQSDPDYLTHQEFRSIFGRGESVLLLAEASDPFALDVLRYVDAIGREIGKESGIEAHSLLGVYRRSRPGFELDAEGAAALRAFATGTDLFRRQGMMGEGFLGIAVGFDGGDPAERDRALGAIEAAVGRVSAAPPGMSLRRIGAAYVDSYLERETKRAAPRYFPLFGLFVVVLNVGLYRSFRALAAFLTTLATCVAIGIGYAGLVGYQYSIVAALVPMTILITATATLVYIHSRFVEHPDGESVEDHQIFALENKFLPCTASIFATAVGFAALAVSKIRPIREMGIWVAVALVFTWVVVFTLFPALQRIFATPTQQQRKVAGQWFLGFTAWLPLFTYRRRWPLVVASLALWTWGAASVFGVPGWIAPMPLRTDSLDYINPNTNLYRDHRRLEKLLSGLSVTEVWLHHPAGVVTDPEILRGLDRFATDLESDPNVGAAIGVTSVLRTLRYLEGNGDRLPEDPAALERLSGDLEQLLPEESALRAFVDLGTLSHTRISVLSRDGSWEGFQALEARIRNGWAKAVAGEPALAPLTLRIAGQGPLQAKIAHHLVPTLVESLLLTVCVIFGTFLIVFRNGMARLMAIIPSLFAILVMFGVMRVAGITLNVATILIASTVLGASENDQIHFFYHYLERRRTGTTEQGLRHTLLIAGRAIGFATLINAGGFLALALSDLPPMRQFGILSALAFVVSMIADFTALPASMWLLLKDKPDALKPAPGA